MHSLIEDMTWQAKLEREDDITGIIDDFCRDLVVQVSSETSMPIDEQVMVFRHFLHMHWGVLVSQLVVDKPSRNVQSHAHFYQLGLPIKWLYDAQKFILNRLSENAIKKQTRWGYRRDDKIHALMNLIMDDLFCFYTFPLNPAQQTSGDERIKVSQFLQRTITSILKGVAESASDLVKVTCDVSQTAHRIDEQVGSIASLSMLFSEELSGASRTTQRLSCAIDHISDRIANGVSVTQKSALEAEQAQEVVQSLSHAANKIGEVVKIINEIANQTNLLALNATIEAARAGNAGKGFSVVASEVKSLAGQTAKATEEITKQIKAMQNETNHVVVSIHEMSVTIRRINEGTIEISSAINEQEKMAQDTLKNIEKINEVSLALMQFTNQLGDLSRATDDGIQQTQTFSAHIADRSHYLIETLEQIT